MFRTTPDSSRTSCSVETALSRATSRNPFARSKVLAEISVSDPVPSRTSSVGVDHFRVVLIKSRVIFDENTDEFVRLFAHIGNRCAGDEPRSFPFRISLRHSDLRRCQGRYTPRPRRSSNEPATSGYTRALPERRRAIMIRPNKADPNNQTEAGNGIGATSTLKPPKSFSIQAKPFSGA